MKLNLNDSVPGHRDGEIFVNCPFCLERVGKEDTAYHMGVSMTKNIYHCFRCDASDILDKSILERLQSIPGNVETFYDRVTALYDSYFNKKKSESHVDYDLISTPISKETPISHKYLSQRGITDSIIKKYDIRVGRTYEFMDKKSSKWASRILFPVIFNKKVVTVVGRTYTDDNIKYLNTVGNKDVSVFGMNFVKNEAILCEGILSAIKAEMATGVPSIACLGKSPLYSQLSYVRSKCNILYLSLDSDVTYREYEKLIRRCFKLKFIVKLVRIPLDIKVEGSKRIKLCDPDDHFNIYKTLFINSIDLNILNYKKILMDYVGGNK